MTQQTPATDTVCVLVAVGLREGAASHPEDCWEDGEDAIDGYYGFELDPAAVAARAVEEGEDPAIEAALDAFHDEIGIKMLDSYDIQAVRLETKERAPEATSWR